MNTQVCVRTASGDIKTFAARLGGENPSHSSYRELLEKFSRFMAETQGTPVSPRDLTVAQKFQCDYQGGATIPPFTEVEWLDKARAKVDPIFSTA